MVVVATHNNIDFLVYMVGRLSGMNLYGHRVVFVDTNSDDVNYIKVFNDLSVNNSRGDFFFDRKNYTCWDSGAYIHGYKNYEDDKYIFLQDSIEITNDEFFSEMNHYLSEFDVVSILGFGYYYDNKQQETWVEQGSNILVNGIPAEGIFGPIFCVTKNALDKIPKEWLIEPKNKIEGCGMERRWSLMFHAVGVSKHYLEGENQPFSKHKVDTCTKYIKKIWANRK